MWGSEIRDFETIKVVAPSARHSSQWRSCLRPHGGPLVFASIITATWTARLPSPEWLPVQLEHSVKSQFTEAGWQHRRQSGDAPRTRGRRLLSAEPDETAYRIQSRAKPAKTSEVTAQPLAIPGPIIQDAHGSRMLGTRGLPVIQESPQPKGPKNYRPEALLPTGKL